MKLILGRTASALHADPGCEAVVLMGTQSPRPGSEAAWLWLQASSSQLTWSNCPQPDSELAPSSGPLQPCRALGPAHLRAIATTSHMFANCTSGNRPRSWLTGLLRTGQLWVHMKGILGKCLHPLPLPTPTGSMAARIGRGGARACLGLMVFIVPMSVEAAQPPGSSLCSPPRWTKMLGEVDAADRGPQIPTPFPAMLPPHSRSLTEEEGGRKGSWGPGCNMHLFPGRFLSALSHSRGAGSSNAFSSVQQLCPTELPETMEMSSVRAVRGGGPGHRGCELSKHGSFD